jgi:hypothetical protein
VDDERPPYAFVQVTGAAEVSERAPDLLTWTTRIGARYMGAAQAEAFGRRNAVEGEFLVRVTPTRVIARWEVAS